jgi:branched-chain amino acid transport system ATP-binding protein
MTDLLTIDALSMRFGGLQALDSLSITVKKDAVTAIIGPNGAGKTTLFNCITGFYPLQAGAITLTTPDGRLSLGGMSDHAIVRKAKIARTFQTTRLFPRMTAVENLIVAQHARLMKASLFTVAGLLGMKRYARAEREAMEKAAFWLEQVGLYPQANVEAGSLPYGSQRRLEIARAMCLDPVLLCLDEPAAGLNPRESAELVALLTGIRDRFNTAQLLIEHDMSVVMGLSDYVFVLECGRKIAEGTPEQIRLNPVVIRAYLGETPDEELPSEIAKDFKTGDFA